MVILQKPVEKIFGRPEMFGVTPDMQSLCTVGVT